MKFRLTLALATSLFLISCQTDSPESDPPVAQAETDDDFVGISLSDGEKLALKRDLLYRITMLDGKPQAATRDYRENRVNFAVENGKIVGVSRG
ncbi:MAG: hypothetical protein P1U68_15505 [Verrucomicrobiales bacterium]|nr:hypothetical protein [Verrucomicrobiales bacterium]